MSLPETIPTIRYVTDANGEKTDVLVPLMAWEALNAAWDKLTELLEDQEDQAILQEWLRKRAAGEVETIPLDQLERELISDGLLPS